MKDSMTGSDITSSLTYKEVFEQVENDPYAGKPNGLFRMLSSKKKGSVFEKLTEEYLSSSCEVKKSHNSDHDRVIVVNGRELKVEIKGSTLWEGTDFFRWQQIRPSQDYDIVIFLAVYPERTDFYYAEKEALSDFLLQQDEKGFYPHNQHGGKKKNSGTFFLQGKPADFPVMKPISDLFFN